MRQAGIVNVIQVHESASNEPTTISVGDRCKYVAIDGRKVHVGLVVGIRYQRSAAGH